MSVTTSDVGFRVDGVMKANNVNFSGMPNDSSEEVLNNGELLIGSAIMPHIRTGTLTSPLGTVSIGYVAPNITIDVAGGSIAVDSFLVDSAVAPGTNPTFPDGAGQIQLSGSAGNAIGFPVRMISNSAPNRIDAVVQVSSQQAASLIINAGICSFDSAQFTVDALGFVNSIAGPGSINITPDLGVNITNSTFNFNASVFPGALNPIITFGTAANQLTLQVNTSSEQALSDVTKCGLSSFNSLHFDVDPATGWVSLLNGLSASAFDVQANTAPGTDPVLPSALGVVQVNGSIVAAQLIPIRTNSLAVNAYNIETQYSSAQVVDTAAASGMCHFDAAQFTVSATGFVQSLASVAFTWQDSAPVAMAIFNGYFATGAGAYLLPLGAVDGETIEIIDQIGGGVVVTAAGAQTIRVQNVNSSAGGTCTSTQFGDALRLIFRASIGEWQVCPGAGGNWILA